MEFPPLQRLHSQSYPAEKLILFGSENYERFNLHWNANISMHFLKSVI